MSKPGRMVGAVLRSATRRPATHDYPATPVKLPAAFRGKVRFIASRCVGCMLCQKDCPSGALFIEKVGDKRYRAVFLLDHCIFCAQCVDSCNKGALESTSEFELATMDRATLRVTFDAPPAPTPTAPTDASPAAPGAADPAAR